jgi:tRNA threonylcarbamoyladenosine biosynthesis protein TsaB
MTILAIDTATTVCGVAILRDGAILAEQWIEERSAHAERLFGLTDAVLRIAGVTPLACDAFAVAIGPGSFTGLRIGLSAAKGFHLATGKPVIAVPTLTALAQRCLPLFNGVRGHCVAALDARRDEAYVQTFAMADGVMKPVGEVDARTVAEIVLSLPQGHVVLTGDARQKIAAAAAGDRAGLQRALADDATARCSAATVAQVAETMFIRGEFADAGALEPLYVKEVFLRTAH